MVKGTGEGLQAGNIENLRTTRGAIHSVLPPAGLNDLLLLDFVLHDVLLDLLRADVLALHQYFTDAFDQDFNLFSFLDGRVWPPILCFFPS